MIVRKRLDRFTNFWVTLRTCKSSTLTATITSRTTCEKPVIKSSIPCCGRLIIEGRKPEQRDVLRRLASSCYAPRLYAVAEVSTIFTMSDLVKVPAVVQQAARFAE